MRIRAMREKDLDFAAESTRLEGWAGETREIFESFLAFDPNGCLIAEERDVPIGMCVGVVYGESGFIGEMVVHRRARGGLVGPNLFQQTLSYMKSRGVHSFYLDGVEAAVPYYENMGFRKICRSLRFVGSVSPKSHSHIRPIRDSDLKEIHRLDFAAFGANRSFFLDFRRRRNPRFCRVMIQNGGITGYISAIAGRGVMSIGPIVTAADVTRPFELLESLATEAGDIPFRIGVLESNDEAVRCIRGLPDLKPQVSSWRMVLGPHSRLGTSPQCFAILAPAKG